MYKNLKEILHKNYLLNIINIDKNSESTVGNVYIVYTNNNKYVLKIYDDIKHTKSMILLHQNLSNKFNIPKIILTKDNRGYIEIDNKYIVLYSFLKGIQVGKLDKLTDDIIKQIAIELRELHDSTQNTNKYNLKEIPFYNEYDLERKSLLHFDLTKGNIFYNKDKIEFIDFDDAKYGYSVFDVSILIALFFFSKKRGVDKTNLNLFLDSYYKNDLDLKSKEVKYIKEIALNWIDNVLRANEFHSSLKESFEVKKKLIEENL